MHIRRGLMAAAMCLGLPAAAAAQPTTGAYFAVSGGVNFLWEQEVTNALGIGTSPDVDFEYGWVAAIAGGVRWSMGLRTEMEFGYRLNDADTISGAAGSASLSGDVRALTFMANVIYDIDTGTPFTPYIGAGVGGANVKVDDFSTGGPTFSARDLTFAYQGIAGLGFALDDGIELFVDYRYLSTEGLSLNNGVVSVDDEYTSHTVMAGLRWVFMPLEAAPPPPPPMPALAPVDAGMGDIPRNYIVYFAWDSAALDAEAISTIQTAAANAMAGGFTTIEVAGHADRSGPEPYNLALSRQRADAVRSELGRQGVPDNLITSVYLGETQPRIATPDGVRERENRRVEIAFP